MLTDNDETIDYDEPGEASVSVPYDPRLDDRTVAFCHFFVANGGDAQQAALSCGYPPARAQTTGMALLEREEVSSYVRALWMDEARRAGITASSLIQQVAAMAYSNLDDHVVREVAPDGGVTVKLRENVNRRAMAAVKSITCKETPTKFGMSRTVTVVLHDKVKPVAMLMTLLGVAPRAGQGGQYIDPATELEQYTLEELEAMARKRGLPV